ncbi:hypothetical protein K9M79_03245 [Candidatus Woesearchaeota archaeon]|nr:hypothetical protein [Candidatus Woesearchaeota archaeon]
MKQYFLLVVLIFIPLVHSLDAKIIVKPTFSIGEQIEFNYSIISDELVEYTPTIYCPNFALAPRQIFFSNESVDGYYKGSVVTEKTVSQGCQAILRIIRPVHKNIVHFFNINANEELLFDMSICPAKECLEKRVFMKNQEIEVKYSSSISNINISTTLKTPDGSSKVIELPYSFIPNYTGIYTLSYKVESDGYVGIEKSEQFSVIDKVLNVKQDLQFKDILNNRSLNTSSKENIEQKVVLGPNIKVMMIIILIVSLLAISLFVYFFQRRN